MHFPRPSSVNATSSGWSSIASSASPGRTMLRRLSSSGSRSSAIASSSIADSTANAGWVMPYPRNAPLGTLFV
jgi:hypothetical protein